MALLGAGCSRHTLRQPCTGMGDVGPLVTGAALLQVDIYDGSAHCSGGLLADGTPLLLKSQTFTPGEAIKLAVVPGARAIVLTTFADAAGSTALGQACLEAQLPSGSELCFDLTVLPYPDLSVPPAADLSVPPGMDLRAPLVDLGPTCTTSPDSCPHAQYCDGRTCLPGCKASSDCSVDGGLKVCDLATHTCQECLQSSDCGGAAGSACCNRRCMNLNIDVANCGACGNVCDTTTNGGRSCSGGSCAYAPCNPGLADCNSATAPNLDGCEVNTQTSLANCGGCGIVCSTSNLTPSCTAGSCNGSCASGFVDCDANKQTNGCECQGTGCCGGSCQVKHHTRSGTESATWPVFYDCTSSSGAIGSVSDALAACTAHATANGLSNQCASSSGYCTFTPMVCNGFSNGAYCWVYGSDLFFNNYTAIVVRYPNCPPGGTLGNWD